MASESPSFPWVGVAAPVVAGLTLWTITGSAFALIGAVLGPVMMIAHFGDSVRRHRRSTRIAASAQRVENEAVNRSKRLVLKEEHRVANLEHPALSDIVSQTGWTPSFDGSTTVRAGSMSRDGMSGFPWLLDASADVAVVGEGVAAEAVWHTLLVHLSASLGHGDENGSSVAWSGGVRLLRGESTAGVTIRCAGDRIESVTRRGRIPESGDWRFDNDNGWRSVLDRCASVVHELDWTERSRCAFGIGLSDSLPFRLDLSSTNSHVLIAGRTGTGKSELLAALLCDWSERFTTHELSWVGFDFKGGAALTPLSVLPHCRAVLTDLDGDHMERALLGLAAELLDREKHLSLEGAARIEDSTVLGRLVIVIDEFPELCRQFPDAIDVLTAIARRGRSLGVHLVLTTQLVGSVHRDGLAANMPVRICFPLATQHDVVSVVGGAPTRMPGTGRPLIVTGDGHQHSVTVRCGATGAQVNCSAGDRLPPPWLNPIAPPLRGETGFGLIDDPATRTRNVAVWEPADGDVVIVGRRGSGRTTAIWSLLGRNRASWVSNLDSLAEAHGVIVVDDIDRLFSELPESRRHELTALIASRKLAPDPPTFVFASTVWSPRIHGQSAHVLVLGMQNREQHIATGEPPQLFSPDSEPGVGSWRGKRVVVYTRTDSSETESIP